MLSACFFGIISIRPELKLWDVKTGKIIRTFNGHSSSVTSVAFSADGRWVISGGDKDGTVRLWRTGTGKLVKIFKKHHAAVVAVAFSTKGHQVFSGCKDGAFRVWDVASGRLIKTSGHFFNAVFSPNGQLYAATDEDNTIKLWSTKTNQLLLTFVVGDNGAWLAVTPVGFYNGSPEGGKLMLIQRGFEMIGDGDQQKQLYRPDLVAEVLRGDPEGRYKAAASKLHFDVH